MEVEKIEVNSAEEREKQNVFRTFGKELKDFGGTVLQGITKPFQKNKNEQMTQITQVETPQKYKFDRVSSNSLEYQQIKTEFSKVIPDFFPDGQTTDIFKSGDVYRFRNTFTVGDKEIDCMFYLKKMKIGDTIQYLPLQNVDDEKFKKSVPNPCYGERLGAYNNRKIYEKYGNNAILKNDMVYDVPTFNGKNYGKKFENLTPIYNAEKTQEHCKEILRKKELLLAGIDDLSPSKIQLTDDQKKLLLYTVAGGVNQNYDNSTMHNINLQQRLQNSLVLDKEVKVSGDQYTRTFVIKDNQGKLQSTNVTITYQLDNDGKLTINNDNSNINLNNIGNPTVSDTGNNIKLTFDSNDINTYQETQIQEFSKLYNEVNVTGTINNSGFSLSSTLYPYNSTEPTDAIDPKAIDKNGNVKFGDKFYYAQDKKIYDLYGKEVSTAFFDRYGVKNTDEGLKFIQITDKIQPYHLLTFMKDGRTWEIQPHYDGSNLIIFDKKGNQVSECPVEWKEQQNPDDKDAGYKYKENEEVELKSEDFYTELFKKVQVDNTFLTTEQLKQIFDKKFESLPEKVKKFKGMKVQQEDGTMELYTTKSESDIVELTKVNHDEIRKLIDTLALMNTRLNKIQNMTAEIANKSNREPLSSQYANAGMGMKFTLDANSLNDFPDGLKVKVNLLNNTNIQSEITLIYKGKTESGKFELDSGHPCKSYHQGSKRKTESGKFELDSGQLYDKFQLGSTKYKLDFKDGDNPLLTLNVLSRKDQN